MTRSRLLRSLREWALIVLLVAVITGGIDAIRTPTLPDSMGLTRVAVNGSMTTLSALSQDKPLLVYLWASWCPVCKLTTPTVAKLAAEGVNLQTVALRSGDENRIQRLLAAKGWSIPVINDSNGALAAQWDISVTPTFIILYRGTVVSVTTGWTSGWGLRARLMWASYRTE